MTTEKTPAEGAQTSEDKFFGVKTTIDEMTASESDNKDDEEKVIIETVEDGEGGVIATEPPDTDDKELTDYSKDVQKRIDKLTWQREEAKREAANAEAIRAEAVRYAQTLNQQNQQQANIIATGEARLVEQIKTRAVLSVESATNKYRSAYEAGDTEAIINAQKELTIAQAEQLEGYNYEQDYNRRVQNWTAQQQWQQQQQQRQQQQRQQQPQQQQQAQPVTTTSEKSWAEKNPWFGKAAHRDMTALAYAEHERVTRDEGIPADSEKYYELIDAKVQRHFPRYFAEHGGGTPNPANPPTVVAPGNRNNAGRSRTVRLEPHQVALARELGLTTEQYAKQVLKESRNG